MNMRERIVFGVAGLLIAAAVAPAVVGTLLMLFSVLVLIFAIIGACWPSLLKLPNRLASVWVFTLAFGLFLGGGMLISPPNGSSTASDAPPENQVRRPIESPARDRHIREMEQAAAARRRQERPRPAPARPAAPVDTGAPVILCHEYVQERIAGIGVRVDFPAFMDGARGAEHLGGTAYSFRSYVDLIDGNQTERLHYYCAVEDGAVVLFNER